MITPKKNILIETADEQIFTKSKFLIIKIYGFQIKNSIYLIIKILKLILIRLVVYLTSF